MVLFEEGATSSMRSGSAERRSLARMSTREFHEAREREQQALSEVAEDVVPAASSWTVAASSDTAAPSETEDLEVVINNPPILEPKDNAEKIMMAVGSAVGSALHQVTSQLGLVKQGSDSSLGTMSMAPSWIGCGWNVQPPVGQRMRHVSTSPALQRLGAQVQQASASSAGMEAASSSNARSERRTSTHWPSGAHGPPGGHFSDVPVAGLLGEGVSIIWQRGVADLPGDDEHDCEDGGLTVITMNSEAFRAGGRGIGLPLNPLLRRSSQNINLQFNKLSSNSAEQGGSQASQLQLGKFKKVKKTSSVEDKLAAAAQSRSSILDYEQLFTQYFVGVTLRRPRILDVLRRKGASGCRAIQPALPGAQELAEAWRSEALDFLWRNRQEWQRRWPELDECSRKWVSFERKLGPLLEAELHWQDDMSGPHKRLVLALEPERVCHRLLWAVGDANAPEQFLRDIERGLRRRFPHCRVRCADEMWSPAGIFQILVIVKTILLAFGVYSLYLGIHEAHVAMNAPVMPKNKNDPGMLSREERMDQLAARFLLVGSLLQLWLLHAVAAAFPLRSLHSPFRRDLGCLAAYSNTSSMLFRYLGPLAALAMPTAMAIRWNRLGRWVGKIAVLLDASADRQMGWHTLSFCCAASLPMLTIAAAWSVRSSMYSHHHLFITLTFLSHLTVAFFFAVSFDMVKWATLGACGIVAFGVFLFARYTAEFTNASLLRAAQLQWACAHLVPMLGLLLACALEVEAGFAMALIDFICENQDIIPVKMCIRMLRNAD